MKKNDKKLLFKIHLQYHLRKLQSLVSLFIKKAPQAILFVPHESCKKEGYDIINWTGDNVLCLAHHMIESSRYDCFKKIIVLDSVKDPRVFVEYCNKLNPGSNVFFIEKKQAVKESRKVKFIFTSSSVQVFNNKTSKQVLVDLNYFTPFKNDYLYNKEMRKVVYKTRKCFDYIVTTSHLSSRIQALDLGLPLTSFADLGFPRNDIFYRESNSVVLSYLQDHFHFDIKRLIVFTPTYRDYESDLAVTKDLFGYASFDYVRLEECLCESQAVILVKMHALQIANVDFKNIKEKCKRIVLFEELERHFSLYQCLNEADCLITDYTSVYFDFLHRNKPVIFNFYDLLDYSKLRGLSYYPIEAISAGYIVKQQDDLIDSISAVLKLEDKFYNERQIIKRLFDSHYDGLSTERICKFFFGV